MASPRRVLVVTHRHRPHELVLLLLSVMLGLAYTLGAPAPQSVAATMYPWVVHAWAGLLLASGVVGLPACLVPWDVRLGLRLEMGAMLIGAGALIVTVAAIVSFAGVSNGSFGIGFCAAWCAANLWRTAQIRRDLREM
jgi:hypothetical protein